MSFLSPFRLPRPTLDWTAPLGDYVRDLQWAPGGAHLVAALADGTAAVLEAVSGRTVSRIAAHRFAVTRAAFSPVAPVLATAGEDGFVRWWDVSTWTMLGEHRERASWVENLAWSPDGRHLATTSGRVLKVWNADGTLHREWAPEVSTISALQWRSDSAGLAIAFYGAAKLWRLADAKPYGVLEQRTPLLQLAWSPNSRHVASTSQENTVIYWRLPFTDREPLQMSGYEGRIDALAWDAESRLLATGGSTPITVWDVSGKGPAGTKPQQIEGHLEIVSALAWQRRGLLLASGCGGGHVGLSAPAKSPDLLTLTALDGAVTRLAWSPDETRLAAASTGGSVALLNLASGG